MVHFVEKEKGTYTRWQRQGLTEMDNKDNKAHKTKLPYRHIDYQTDIRTGRLKCSKCFNCFKIPMSTATAMSAAAASEATGGLNLDMRCFNLNCSFGPISQIILHIFSSRIILHIVLVYLILLLIFPYLHFLHWSFSLFALKRVFLCLGFCS